jgi:chromosome segregation ATPase
MKAVVLNNTRETFHLQQALSQFTPPVGSEEQTPSHFNQDKRAQKLEMKRLQQILHRSESDIEIYERDFITFMLEDLSYLYEHIRAKSDSAEETITQLRTEILKHDDKNNRLSEVNNVALDTIDAHKREIDKLRTKLETSEELSEEIIKQKRNSYHSRLSESTREHEATVRKLKDQYATRIDEAEATLENEQLTTDYNDALAELQDLNIAQDALTKKNQTSGTQNTSAQQHGGTLQSYGADLDMLEAYWYRQHHFAEIAIRGKTAEIQKIDTVIAAVNRILASLSIPQREPELEPMPPVNDPNDTELYDEPEPAPSQSTDPTPSSVPRTNLLPATSEEAYPALPPARPKDAKAKAAVKDTWAKKAALPERRKEELVQTEYLGSGVSTAKGKKGGKKK